MDAYQSLSHHVASRQERDNKGWLPIQNYSPEDKVYIYQTFGHGQRTKLDMVWSPKATILCQNGIETYQVKDHNGKILNRVHASCLKPLVTKLDELN